MADAANSQKRRMIMPFVALLLLACSTAIASAISDSPFLVAHKKATLIKLKNGSERVSVSIDVYNRGSVSAYDVSLVDDSWPLDMFDVVSGNTSMTRELLDGDSLVSHSFELEPKVKTVFQGSPAVINYRSPTTSVLQVAYSTPIFPLDILADKTPEKKLELAKRLLERFGPQFSAISLVALFGYILAAPSKSNATKGNKKRR